MHWYISMKLICTIYQKCILAYRVHRACTKRCKASMDTVCQVLLTRCCTDPLVVCFILRSFCITSSRQRGQSSSFKTNLKQTLIAGKCRLFISTAYRNFVLHLADEFMQDANQPLQRRALPVLFEHMHVTNMRVLVWECIILHLLGPTWEFIEAISTSVCFILLTRGWGRLETTLPVIICVPLALESSPELYVGHDLHEKIFSCFLVLDCFFW